MSRYSNNYYNKSLKDFAGSFEKIVRDRKPWYGVRCFREGKCWFIVFFEKDRYIADFFSKELKLIIELDVYTHQFEEVARKDRIREDRLKSLECH